MHLSSVMDAEVRSENRNLFPSHNIIPSLTLHSSYTSPSFVVFNILSRQNLDHWLTIIVAIGPFQDQAYHVTSETCPLYKFLSMFDPKRKIMSWWFREKQQHKFTTGQARLQNKLLLRSEIIGESHRFHALSSDHAILARVLVREICFICRVNNQPP